MMVLPADDAAKKELPPPSYRSLSAPVATPVDKFALLPAFLKVRGLVKEHIDSFNYFITRGIKNIVEANNRIEARNDPTIYLRYAMQSIIQKRNGFRFPFPLPQHFLNKLMNNFLGCI
jgi:DNA-directed RNA polymerase III subunit RPC2